MKPEDLIDAIGMVDEDLIEKPENSLENPLKGQVGWKRRLIRWTLALCVLAGAVLVILWPEIGPKNNTARLSGEKGYIYKDYYGPVFPLSTAEKYESILASRQIDYDFSYYAKKNSIFSSDQSLPFASVTDSYRLKNGSAETQTVTLRYPFNAALIEKAPSFLLNGEKTAAEFYTGSELTISNAIAWGLLNTDEWNRKLYEGTLNLGIMGAAGPADKAEEYLNLPVTVYRISDVWPERKKAGSDTLMLLLEYPAADPEKTIVLSYGAGYVVFNKNGTGGRGYSIYKEKQYSPDYYMIVIGEDIGPYELRAYTNPALQETAEAGGTVTRYETTLSKILEETAFDCWEVMAKEQLKESSLSLEETVYAQIPRETLLTSLVCQMAENGLLSFGKMPDSQNGELTEVYRSILCSERILFAEFSAAVPAGESLAFSALLEKKGSSIRDEGEQPIKYRDICRGYDMLTKTGSLLRFETQTASVSHFDAITITDQNFGFDLQNGITEVLLDPETEYYFMNVKKKK